MNIKLDYRKKKVKALILRLEYNRKKIFKEILRVVIAKLCMKILQKLSLIVLFLALTLIFIFYQLILQHFQ